MAITPRGANTASTNAGTSISVTLPSNIEVGDLILVGIGHRAGSNGTITAPAGWVEALAQINSNTVLAAAIFKRIAQSGDAGASVTFESGSGSNTKITAIAQAYGNVDQTNPINGIGGQANASSVNIVAPAITAASPSLRVMFASTATGTTIGETTGWTQSGHISTGGGATGTRNTSAQQARADATVNPPSVTAVAGAAAVNIGAQIALAEAAATTVSAAFTADVVIRRTQAAAFTADAVIGTPPPSGSLVVADAFERTEASVWGTADVGGDWDIAGDGFSVGSGVGQLSIAEGTAGTPRNGVVNEGTISAVDVDGLVRFRVDSLPGGGSHQFWVYGRRVNGSQYYRPRVRVYPSGALDITTQFDEGSGTGTIGTAFSPGVTITANQWVWVRWQVETISGENHIRTKVWKDGDPEPGSYQLVDQHTSTTLQAGGTTGVRLQASTSASHTTWPVIFQVDDLEFRLLDEPGSGGAFTASAVLKRATLGSFTADAVIGEGSPPPGDFATVTATLGVAESTSDTSAIIAIPAVSAGDRLIIAFASDGGGAQTHTWPTSPAWTQILFSDAISSHTPEVRSRDIDGTEGWGSGGTVEVTISANEACSAVVIKVAAGTFDATEPPADADFASGTSTTPDPPSLTAPWGSAKNVWLAVAFGDAASITVDGYPTGYNDNQINANGASTGASFVAVATKNNETATEDPGTFLLSASEQWSATTIAIRPAAGTGGVAGSFTADAVVRRGQTAGLAADAVLRRERVGSATADAVLRRAVAGSLTANAVLRRSQAASFTANAVVRSAIGESFTADAVLRQTQAASFTASAVLKRATLGSFTADAVIGEGSLVVRYVAANAGSYAYLDNKRWDGSAFTALSGTDLTDCPTYNDWKYGLDGRTGYPAQSTAQELRDQFQGRLFHLIAGAADTDPAAEDLDTTCPGTWQGAHRLERAQRFFDHLADHYAAVTHTLDVVPELAHSGVRALNSGAARARMFNVSLASTYGWDSFNRTESGTWGSADIGGSWSHATAADHAVSGGVGTQTMPVVNSHRMARLTGIPFLDTEVFAQFSTDKLAVGGSIFVYPILRYQDASNYYRGRIAMQTNGTFTGRWQSVVAGVSTDLNVNVDLSAETHEAGVWYNVRAQAEGVSPTTLRMKVWRVGTSEPSGWDTTATDSTAALQVAGAPGVRSILSSAATNAPVVASWRRFHFGGLTGAEPLLTATRAVAPAVKDFAIAGGGTLPYWSDGDLAAGSSASRAIIVMHGATRNGSDYYTYAKNSAALSSSDALVIAPQEVRSGDTGYAASSLLYAAGGWVAGADSTNESNTSSYAAIDQIIERLSNTTDFPNVAEIVVIGHSAGGQFTQRYALTSTASGVGLSETFTADAVIRRGQTGSLTVDSVLRRTRAGAFTGDAMLRRTIAGSFTADAVVQAAIVGSFIASAIVREAIAGSLTADAVLLRTGASSLTADAVVRGSQAGSLTADAVIAAVATGALTANAILRASIVGTFTADAVLAVGQFTVEGSFPADAVLRVERTESLAADAIVQRTIAGSTVADAVLRRAQATDFTADAVLRQATSASLWADAVLSRTVTDSFTADAWLSAAGSGSFTADAIVQRAIVGDLVADAVIRRAIAASFTADAVLRSERSASITAEAVLRRAAAAALTTDAVLRSTRAGSITADAVVLAAQTGALTADAVLWATSVGALTVDAHLRAIRGGDFTADAIVREVAEHSFTANAFIQGEGVAAFSTDAVLFRTQLATLTGDAVFRVGREAALTADAFIRRVVEGDFTADAIVREVAEHSFTANAFIQGEGVAAFSTDAVLFRTQAHAFVADALVRRPASATVTADAVVRAAFTAGFTADAVTLQTVAASLSADAVLLATRMAGFVADAVLLSPRTHSLTGDAVLLVNRTGVLTADAIVRRPRSAVLDADAVIRATAALGFTADAFIVAAGIVSGAFTADAIIRVTAERSFTADAIVRVAATATFVADAHLRAVRLASLTADAVLFRSVESGLTADAVLSVERIGLFTIDAQLRLVGTESFLADAVLRASLSNLVLADAVLRATRPETFTTDAVVRRTSASVFTADAFIAGGTAGSFSADAILRRVQLASFTIDAVITTGDHAHVSATIAGDVASATIATDPEAVSSLIAADHLRAELGDGELLASGLGADHVRSVLGG